MLETSKKSLTNTLKKKWHNPELGALREIITMSIGAFYWWATTLEDLLSPSDKTKTPLNYSWITLLIAIPTALLVATATTYVHFIQENYHKKQMTRASVDIENDPRKTIVIPDETNLSWWRKTQHAYTVYGTLSSIQLFFLGVASLGHATDFVGFITNITNTLLSKYLSKNALISISFLYVLFGLVASRAEIRSCWSDMVKDELEQANKLLPAPENISDDTKLEADNASKISLIAKTFQTLATDLVFYAKLIDLVGGIKANTPIGVSTRGLAMATIPAVFITWGTVYGQYFINLLQQSHHEISIHSNENEMTSDSSPTIQLTSVEEFFLANLPFGTAADFAEQLDYLIEPLIQSTPLKILLQFITILTGLLTSGSAHMNAEDNLRNYKKIHRIYGNNPAISIFPDKCDIRKNVNSITQPLLVEDRPSLL